MTVYGASGGAAGSDSGGVTTLGAAGGSGGQVTLTLDGPYSSALSLALTFGQGGGKGTTNTTTADGGTGFTAGERGAPGASGVPVQTDDGTNIGYYSHAGGGGQSSSTFASSETAFGTAGPAGTTGQAGTAGFVTVFYCS